MSDDLASFDSVAVADAQTHTKFVGRYRLMLRHEPPLFITLKLTRHWATLHLHLHLPIVCSWEDIVVGELCTVSTQHRMRNCIIFLIRSILTCFFFFLSFFLSFADVSFYHRFFTISEYGCGRLDFWKRKRRFSTIFYFSLSLSPPHWDISRARKLPAVHN